MKTETKSWFAAVVCVCDNDSTLGLKKKKYYLRSVAETRNHETKHHTVRVGELRFITSVGSEELALQALSPKQKGYRDFIDKL